MLFLGAFYTYALDDSLALGFSQFRVQHGRQVIGEQHKNRTNPYKSKYIY